jgi:hypothetical protein
LKGSFYRLWKKIPSLFLTGLSIKSIKNFLWILIIEVFTEKKFLFIDALKILKI